MSSPQVSRRRFLQATAAVGAAGSVGVVSGQSQNGKLVIIYDDGHDGAMSEALPVHKEEGVPACAAIVAGYTPWTRKDHDYRLVGDEIRTLEDEGWEIISHGLYHRNLGEQPVTQPVAPEDEKIWVRDNIHGAFPDREYEIRITDGEKTATAPVVGANTGENGDYLILGKPVGKSFDPADGVTERFVESEIRRSMEKSQEVIASHGIDKPQHFVYPYGARSPLAQELATEYYTSITNYEVEGLNPMTGLNPHRLNRQQMEGRALNESELAHMMATISDENRLAVFGAHTQYDDLGPERIRKVIREAKYQGIDIVTMTEALEAAEIKPKFQETATKTTTQPPTTTGSTTAGSAATTGTTNGSGGDGGEQPGASQLPGMGLLAGAAGLLGGAELARRRGGED
ncbi:polysaccharide deacetylase family protein [Haloarchaeobius amylolyticus]|uniref:polysaccharide deacetylase family protein n=1 Tax=Haloarchaeobius amylolyticus TaxID=1198296 RepID=UPI0022711B25|nr:polysaccharide deacetylase family protein [Haloarchaeobius amylolyticus]